METLPVKPERLAQLQEYARRHGKSPADALDDALAGYLDWERQDYLEAVEGVRRGLEDVKAGSERWFVALRATIAAPGHAGNRGFASLASNHGNLSVP